MNWFSVPSKLFFFQINFQNKSSKIVSAVKRCLTANNPNRRERARKRSLIILYRNDWKDWGGQLQCFWCKAKLFSFSKKEVFLNEQVSFVEQDNICRAVKETMTSLKLLIYLSHFKFQAWLFFKLSLKSIYKKAQFKFHNILKTIKQKNYNWLNRNVYYVLGCVNLSLKLSRICHFQTNNYGSKLSLKQELCT